MQARPHGAYLPAPAALFADMIAGKFDFDLPTQCSENPPLFLSLILSYGCSLTLNQALCTELFIKNNLNNKLLNFLTCGMVNYDYW
jgi:hypothetical protein